MIFFLMTHSPDMLGVFVSSNYASSFKPSNMLGVFASSSEARFTKYT